MYIDTIISYYIEYMETHVFQPYGVTSLESRLGLGELSPNGSKFQVSEVFQFTQLDLSFGKKTWLAGKKPLRIEVSWEISCKWWIFHLATFDDRRVVGYDMI